MSSSRVRAGAGCCKSIRGQVKWCTANGLWWWVTGSGGQHDLTHQQLPVIRGSCHKSSPNLWMHKCTSHVCACVCVRVCACMCACDRLLMKSRPQGPEELAMARRAGVGQNNADGRCGRQSPASRPCPGTRNPSQTVRRRLVLFPWSEQWQMLRLETCLSAGRLAA